jgi:probable HAF family extracellular repeat protein
MAARLILVSVLLAVSSTFAAPTYSITDLGTLGGSFSDAYGVNDAGQVVGYSTLAVSGVRGFLWSGGSLTDLGTLPGSTNSYGTDLNEAGQVVGYSTFQDSNHSRAFLWYGGSLTDLGTLGGDYTRADGINEAGQVVGEASLTTGASHAFRYSGGTMTDLGTLGGGWSEAFDINDTGQIVGDSYITGNSAYHAFRYSGSSMTDLGVLNGHYSIAYGINASGDAVGYRSFTGDVSYRACRWSGGVMSDLPSLFAGASSNAEAINSAGDVVGYSFLSGTGGAYHAFVYSGWTIADLNSYLPTGSGWTLYEARDINDYGDICGWGYSPSGQRHGFLMTRTDVTRTVIPEPSLATLLLLALVPALIVYRKRR